MASQIIGVSFVCSTVWSGADQRKHQSSASLAFVRGIHRLIPSLRASNAENISIWRRHHAPAQMKAWQCTVLLVLRIRILAEIPPMHRDRCRTSVVSQGKSYVRPSYEILSVHGVLVTTLGELTKWVFIWLWIRGWCVHDEYTLWFVLEIRWRLRSHGKYGVRPRKCHTFNLACLIPLKAILPESCL